jgi:hypothetical protein
MPPNAASTQQLAPGARAGKRASTETNDDNHRRRRGRHDPVSTAYSAMDRIPVRSSPVQQRTNALDREAIDSAPATTTSFSIQQSVDTSRASFITAVLSSQSSDATDATNYTDLHDRNGSPNISFVSSVEVNRSFRGSTLGTAKQSRGFPGLMCSNAATHGIKHATEKSKDYDRLMRKIWREWLDIPVLENSHIHQ